MNKNLYSDGTYISQNPTWHIEDSDWKARQIIKLMDKNLVDLTSVAEIGCGFGAILNSLYKNYNNKITYNGFDVSPQAVEYASKTFPHINFSMLNDFECLDHSDLILIIDVIEHVEDYYSFLNRIKNKSRYKIFHVPIDITFKGIWRDDLSKSWEKVGHIHFFSKEIILKILLKCGYRIIDYSVTKPPIELTGDSKKKKVKSILHNILYSLNSEIPIKILGGYSLLVLAE